MTLITNLLINSITFDLIYFCVRFVRNYFIKDEKSSCHIIQYRVARSIVCVAIYNITIAYRCNIKKIYTCYVTQDCIYHDRRNTWQTIFFFNGCVSSGNNGQHSETGSLVGFFFLESPFVESDWWMFTNKFPSQLKNLITQNYWRNTSETFVS